MDSDDKYSPDKSHQDKEDKQGKEIEEAISDEYRHHEPDSEYKIKELEQEKEISEEITNEYKKKQSSAKKKYLAITLVAVAVASIFGVNSFVTPISELGEYEISYEPLKSQFLIQNLRGDTIETWISLKVVEGDLFHVHVVDSPYATEERLDAIMDVIMSDEKIVIPDSVLHKDPDGAPTTFYLGWKGALNSIDTSDSPIPKNLHFHVTDKGEGDILIKLINLSSPDGYAGFTNSIVDEAQHQILKSTITIYNIDSISLNQLQTILRHELGHGFGLAHSNAPEDLMAPVITTALPYISECDLDAIELLYDGGQQSKVVCEK